MDRSVVTTFSVIGIAALIAGNFFVFTQPALGKIVTTDIVYSPFDQFDLKDLQAYKLPNGQTDVIGYSFGRGMLYTRLDEDLVTITDYTKINNTRRWIDTVIPIDENYQYMETIDGYFVLKNYKEATVINITSIEEVIGNGFYYLHPRGIALLDGTPHLYIPFEIYMNNTSIWVIADFIWMGTSFSDPVIMTVASPGYRDAKSPVIISGSNLYFRTSENSSIYVIDLKSGDYKDITPVKPDLGQLGVTGFYKQKTVMVGDLAYILTQSGDNIWVTDNSGKLVFMSTGFQQVTYCGKVNLCAVEEVDGTGVLPMDTSLSYANPATSLVLGLVFDGSKVTALNTNLDIDYGLTTAIGQGLSSTYYLVQKQNTTIIDLQLEVAQLESSKPLFEALTIASDVVIAGGIVALILRRKRMKRVEELYPDA